MSYTGIRELTLSDAELAKYYENRFKIQLDCNEYLILRDSNNKIVEKVRYDGNRLVKLKKKIFKTKFDDMGISPQNIEQECWFDILDNDDITCKLVYGGYGTGKTMSSFYWGMGKVFSGDYDKVIYVRNNIDEKDSKPLGSLPGGINEKLYSYALPIADILGRTESINDLLFRGELELAHMGFMRGRTFRNSIIIVSECQNLTSSQIKLLLARTGENSVIIFEGDPEQSDEIKFTQSKGVYTLINALRGNPLFGVIKLEKCQRSKTASLADLF